MSELTILKHEIFKQLTAAAQLVCLAFVSVVLLAGYVRFIEPNWIEVKRVVIHDPALAKSLEGVKVVQISDFHLTHGLGFRERELVRKVNALKPDLIFMTGDYFDSLSQTKPAMKLVGGLKARLGIWGVPGNTDHISMDGKSLTQEFSKVGAEILVNGARRIQVEVGKYFWLVGVDDPVEGHSKLSEALGDVPPGQPTILLAHSPDVFEEAARAAVNLVLVGHTHGGQIGIPFLVRLSEYAYRGPYMRGFYQKGQTKLYVNRGLGTKTLPVRFLCRPEITVIEVKP